MINPPKFSISWEYCETGQYWKKKKRNPIESTQQLCGKSTVKCPVARSHSTDTAKTAASSGEPWLWVLFNGRWCFKIYQKWNNDPGKRHKIQGKVINHVDLPWEGIVSFSSIAQTPQKKAWKTICPANEIEWPISITLNCCGSSKTSVFPFSVRERPSFTT